MRLAKVAALALLVSVIGACWAFRRPWFGANFAVVEANRVYRSAQPTEQLDRWIERFQIKSILNLRGGVPADWWYAAEVHTAQARGVSFYDLPLSATRRPSRRELLLLLEILEQCPYPLLIHCKSGADRTGLASALYLMVRRGEPPEAAENAFSLAFGHIPLLGTEHLHEPFHEYAAWLREQKLAHTRALFRLWVKEVYRSPESHTEPPLIQAGPRVRRTGDAGSVGSCISRSSRAPGLSRIAPARCSSDQ